MRVANGVLAAVAVAPFLVILGHAPGILTLVLGPGGGPSADDVVASFRGDRLPTVIALQWGAPFLCGLVIAAMVAVGRTKPMRPWLLAYLPALASITVVSVITWHIIDP